MRRHHSSSSISRSATAPCWRSTTCPCRCRPASAWHSWERVARGRRRCCAASTGSSTRMAAACCSTAATYRTATSCRCAIGYVPQEGGLLPHWRVGRNVALVPWLNADHDAGARAHRALALVGLDADAVHDRWPNELSGGQRQRVAVARALAGGQRLLLLDEPFGALDAITRHELQEMLLTLQTRGDVTIVLVTHDIGEALRLAHEVLVLRGGHAEQSASPAQLREAPATPYISELLLRSGVTG